MKYCEFCGAGIPAGQKCTCDESVRKRAKTKKLAALGAILATILLLVIIIGTSISAASKIDPTEHLSEPVFSGVDTMGKVAVSFDKDSLIKKIIGTEPSDFFSEEYWQWLQKYEAYSNNIVLEYTPGDLSNGDTFVVKITVTGVAAAEINSVEKSYVVSGLAEVQQVDIFQYINVEFSGIAGDATAKIISVAENDIVDACIFEIDKRYGLEIGEVITVTISNAESLVNQFHVVPLETAKQFAVPSLGRYATANDLPMDIISEIAVQCAAAEQEDIDSEKMERFTYSDAIVCGIYFMEEKDDAWGTNVNELHFLISYDFYVDGEYMRTNYIPYVIECVMVDAEGKTEIQFEDVAEPYVFYTELQSYLDKYDRDYTVTEIG